MPESLCSGVSGMPIHRSCRWREFALSVAVPCEGAIWRCMRRTLVRDDVCLVVVVIAVVLLPVAWLALQTLGGESSKQSTPTPLALAGRKNSRWPHASQDVHLHLLGIHEELAEIA